jgi:hypothetical protein
VESLGGEVGLSSIFLLELVSRANSPRPLLLMLEFEVCCFIGLRFSSSYRMAMLIYIVASLSGVDVTLKLLVVSSPIFGRLITTIPTTFFMFSFETKLRVREH